MFGAGSIKLLLADREFIGVQWFRFLSDNAIPFTIRVKANQIVLTEDGQRMSLKALLRTCRGPRRFKVGFDPKDGEEVLWLGAAARRIAEGELLIVVASKDAHRALQAYRKRWAIESLFADTKTRGLNLEDTRLVDSRKLSLLLAIVALAIAWASKTAAIAVGPRSLPKKSHGYLAKSWFRTGFDLLRYRLRSDPEKAVSTWRNVCLKPRVV